LEWFLIGFTGALRPPEPPGSGSHFFPTFHTPLPLECPTELSRLFFFFEQAVSPLFCLFLFFFARGKFLPSSWTIPFPPYLYCCRVHVFFHQARSTFLYRVSPPSLFSLITWLLGALAFHYPFSGRNSTPATPPSFPLDTISKKTLLTILSSGPNGFFFISYCLRLAFKGVVLFFFFFFLVESNKMFPFLQVLFCTQFLHLPPGTASFLVLPVLFRL